MRAAVYARFSTDLQNERSTEDQIDLCRAYAEREGFEVVATYADKARSGASLIGRDQIMQMLADAQAGKFDAIIVEALDRLSRDMEDLAGIHKRMSFLGIQLLAVHEGAANTLMVGLRGLVGQLMREDNVHKIKRGMTGLVKQGLSAGGRAYGYRPDPTQKGKLLIVEEEAEVVRRIYAEYAEGKSPRAICHDLNRDGIRPPRGERWNASALNGNADRVNGILRNPIYAGTLIWNRVRMVKDPATGRRVSRPNPESEWQRASHPDLCIVPPSLWEAVQGRKGETRKAHPSHHRRPKRMLSGLLKCGCCGAGMASYGADKMGRTRVRCSAATESGTCPDPKSFRLDTIEQLVVDTLHKTLAKPERLQQFVDAYVEERQRLARETAARRSGIERRLAYLAREIDRLIDGYAKDLFNDDDVRSRLPGLKAERSQLEAELSAQPPVPDAPSLHPTAVARYRQLIARMAEAVAQDPIMGETLRDLVTRVTVHRDPTSEKGVRVQIEGRLNALLHLSLDQGKVAVGGRLGGKVVAEDRSGQSTQPVGGSKSRLGGKVVAEARSGQSPQPVIPFTLAAAA